MVRAWKSTLDNQDIFNQSDAFQIRAEVEKFGVYFHETFKSEPAKVKGIVFLEMEGDEIKILPQKAVKGMELLGNNIYRNQWIFGMNKQLLQFRTITAIANQLPFFRAIRPKGKASFTNFAQAIHEQIIEADGD